MFADKAKVYKLIPGVQIINDSFEAGYIVEELSPNGTVKSQYFSNLTKPKLLDKLKDINGFKTRGEQVIEQLLEEID